MKTNIYFLIILIMLSSIACSAENELPESTIKVSKSDWISMEVDSIDGTKITISITYTGEFPGLYSDDYSLEVKKGETWFTLPYAIEIPNGGVAFSLVGIYLNQGNDNKWSTDFTDLYGNLPVGDYRIVKKIDILNNTGQPIVHYICAEFTIQ